MIGARTLALAFVFASGTALAEMAPSEVVIADGAVATSLTGKPGDPASGRATFAGRKLGNCLACHQNADLEDEELFHGEVGPPLDGVADRWSEAELRAIVINSKEVFGDHTIMPAFYRDTGFNRPLEDFDGKTILTAQQVEDLVAYLQTLKE
ncbi:MAG: sulfur oxidation c-type cytochrome SoxX [Pseudomonadota bacterium]